MARLDRWELDRAAAAAVIARDADDRRARAARWWQLADETRVTRCADCGHPLHACELREGWTRCVVCATSPQAAGSATPVVGVAASPVRVDAFPSGVPGPDIRSLPGRGPQRPW